MEKYDKHMGYQLMVIIFQSQCMLLHILRVISIVIADLRDVNKLTETVIPITRLPSSQSRLMKFGNNVSVLMLTLLAHVCVCDRSVNR